MRTRDASDGTVRPALWWHRLDDGRLQCGLCPRGCRLHDGQRGLCFVRARRGDAMVLTTCLPPMAAVRASASTRSRRSRRADPPRLARHRALTASMRRAPARAAARRWRGVSALRPSASAGVGFPCRWPSEGRVQPAPVLAATPLATQAALDGLRAMRDPAPGRAPEPHGGQARQERRHRCGCGARGGVEARRPPVRLTWRRPSWQRPSWQQPSWRQPSWQRASGPASQQPSSPPPP